MDSTTYHVPVMLAEVLEYLPSKPGAVIVDATVGGGGHARAIVDRGILDSVLIGLDRDREALAEAQAKLAGGAGSVILRHAEFDQIAEVLGQLGYTGVDGVLLDLGVSSHQLDEAGRGFTFKDPDSALDMRMDQSSEAATAADLLNGMTELELTRMLRDNADESWAARIAQFVVERRARAPYATAGQLVETVKAAIPLKARSKDIHPATQTFQALRIAVNDEFGNLKRALTNAASLLNPAGRIVVISYHSGEDRIVKQLFAGLAGRCECPPSLPVCVCGAMNPVLRLLTRKPLAPGADEIRRNPRSRSARMRVAERRQ